MGSVLIILIVLAALGLFGSTLQASAILIGIALILYATLGTYWQNRHDKK